MGAFWPNRGSSGRIAAGLSGILVVAAAVVLLAGAASASSTPTITSDQADYAPGSTVTLTGAGWQPGEALHISVNDNVGSTWSYSTDVAADSSGSVTTQFQLPK